jgi:hypothetical protein
MTGGPAIAGFQLRIAELDAARLGGRQAAVLRAEIISRSCSATAARI